MNKPARGRPRLLNVKGRRTVTLSQTAVEIVQARAARQGLSFSSALETLIRESTSRRPTNSL